MKEKVLRAAFLTLGCKVNQNETEAISALFAEKGYKIVDFAEEADIYVINTCTVTHLADRKSRQMIRRAVKTNPRAKVVVTGCYAQTDMEAVQKIPGVSLIVGINEKGHLLDLVEELLANELSVDELSANEKKYTSSEKASLIRQSPRIVVRKYKDIQGFEEIETEKNITRARAYLKIEEGCEQFCSYCIIPYARGPVRSRSLVSTLREAKRLMKAGFREIILIGIHLGEYGRDLGAGINLEYLLKQLLPLDPQVRWRLGSLEPTEVSHELVELMQRYPNFCPHLHLPLQSGHDDILKAMNRPYTTEQYIQIITGIREALPDIAITTDVMVGFPGENEQHFQEYLQFVETVGFSRLHVFKYSPRRGTPAARFADQVAAPVKEVRSRKMMRLGELLEKRYVNKFINQSLDVLVEEKIDETTWEGSSGNYLKVRFKSQNAPRGEIIPVTLRKIAEKHCIGEVFQLK